MFVPLHCHSTYSFHAGVCSPEDLVARASAYGLQAIALTDTDRMSGLIRFYLACQAHGVKPILGVELTDPSKPTSLTLDSQTPQIGHSGTRSTSLPTEKLPASTESSDAGCNVTILARNTRGYGDLIRDAFHLQPEFKAVDAV